MPPSLLETGSRWGGGLALGLLLALWGGAAMWSGWDLIQIERGWSLFIGGAAALAGGAVTISLGFVLARLDRLTQALRAQAPTAKAAPRPEPARGVAPVSQPREEVSEPAVVGRHVSGDTTYVMFSDGSVEVQSPAGAQRFSSLADLKARAEKLPRAGEGREPK